MSLIEENSTDVPAIKEKRKKRKSISNADSLSVLNNVVPIHCDRNKKKKKFHASETANDNIQVCSQMPDSELPVHENVESVSNHIKKKKSQIEELQNIVNECVEQISRTKKVSFNDKINSRLFSTKKDNKLKLPTAQPTDQPPPKSILKHTECGNLITKSKLKKCKARKLQKKDKSMISIPQENHTSKKRDKALQYLERWKNDKKSWKFEKLSQTWLLKNMFDCSMVPENKFLILLEYLTEMTGAAVTLASKLSESILKETEMKTQDSQDESLDKSYHRARSVLQHLR